MTAKRWDSDPWRSATWEGAAESNLRSSANLTLGERLDWLEEMGRVAGLLRRQRRVRAPTTEEPSEPDSDRLRPTLSRQGDGEAHDLGLIVERLGWTPEERLAANNSFLRLYAELRPDGPLIRE